MNSKGDTWIIEFQIKLSSYFCFSVIITIKLRNKIKYTSKVYKAKLLHQSCIECKHIRDSYLISFISVVY